jgi:hypothetical protein
MSDPLALVPITASSTSLVVRSSTRPLVLPGFFVAGLLAMALFLGGAPLLSMCILAASTLSSFAIGSVLVAAVSDKPRRVAPEDIASSELRAAYRSILLRLAEVERALAEAPRLETLMATALERARAAVTLSGQIALLANPLHRYLENHNESFVRSELQRLGERSRATTDEAAVTTWSRAAATWARQLSLHGQIAAQHDRIHARLELVNAGIATFSATIAKLHAADEEQVMLAGDAVTDPLDGLGEELAALESALEVDAAA